MEQGVADSGAARGEAECDRSRRDQALREAAPEGSAVTPAVEGYDPAVVHFVEHVLGTEGYPTHPSWDELSLTRRIAYYQQFVEEWNRMSDQEKRGVLERRRVRGLPDNYHRLPGAIMPPMPVMPPPAPEQDVPPMMRWLPRMLRWRP